MFRCKGTTMCLPHAKVCDGMVDCLLHGEDEKYCDEKGNENAYFRKLLQKESV